LSPESPVEFLENISRPPDRLFVAEVDGPFVSILLAGTGDSLVFAQRDITLDQFRHDIELEWGVRTVRDNKALKDDIARFAAYFEGDTSPFISRVQPLKVSEFTLAVHKIIARIPYGSTLSYKELAEEVGRPLASRAAGSACGKNRTLISIPCHRVLASNGIGGFGAGLHVKKRLLDWEKIDWRSMRNKPKARRLKTMEAPDRPSS